MKWVVVVAAFMHFEMKELKRGQCNRIRSNQAHFHHRPIILK